MHHRHAQALAALQAYCHWLAHFYSEVHSQNQSQFISLITSAVDASSPLITAKVDRFRELVYSLACFYYY